MKKSRPDQSPKGQSFWQTAPGLITAIAALLTAIGGCVAVFTTNPRLMNLVLRPSTTPAVSAVMTAASGASTTSVPTFVSASATAIPASASTSPRPVDLPDGQTVTFFDTLGHQYRYTILSAELDPSPPNQSLLRLKVRAWTDYGVNFWNDSFRLSIGDQQLKPTSFLDVYISGNETSDGEVDFQVDQSAKDAVLTIILPIDMPNNTKQLRLIFP